MVKLIAKPAVTGLPMDKGRARLDAMVIDKAFAISPLAGCGDEVSDLLQQDFAMPFPGVGDAGDHDGISLRWFGRDTALLIGANPDPRLANVAAVVDQSDAWAGFILSGASVHDVLARLTPLDLRDGAFGIGQTARSLIGHMNASITRTGGDVFEILVFRSMAQTALHDLGEAMAVVAARG